MCQRIVSLKRCEGQIEPGQGTLNRHLHCITEYSQRPTDVFCDQQQKIQRVQGYFSILIHYDVSLHHLIKSCLSTVEGGVQSDAQKRFKDRGAELFLMKIQSVQ